MRTDKQVYKLLAANPGWFFELTQITDPGRCVFRSVELKDIALTADGVIEPDAAEQPLFVLEFQAQPDESIYTRLVQEMVLLQRKRPGRKAEGVILFLDLSLDPETEPWCRVVRVYSVLDQLQQLQRHHPEHPLVAVFRPLVESSNENLAADAAGCYNLQTTQMFSRVQSVFQQLHNDLEKHLSRCGCSSPGAVVRASHCFGRGKSGPFCPPDDFHRLCGPVPNVVGVVRPCGNVRKHAGRRSMSEAWRVTP